MKTRLSDHTVRYLLLPFILHLSAIGQQLTCLYENPQRGHFARTFEQVAPAFDLTTKQKLGIFRGCAFRRGEANLGSLYCRIRERANSLGANAYRIDTTWSVRDTITVVLSVYFLSDLEREANFGLMPDNLVIVIGELDAEGPSRWFRVNRNRAFVRPLEYVSLHRSPGDITRITTGKLSMHRKVIKHCPGQHPAYFSFHQLDMYAPQTGYANITIGVFLLSVTGAVQIKQLHNVAPGLGQFLVALMHESTLRNL